ncbi:lipase [Rhodococcus fascians]|nr:lipase [Rhodococcus fascians]
MVMGRRSGVTAVITSVLIASAGVVGAPATAAPAVSGKAGEVVAAEPLRPDLWVAGAASAEKLTYVTTDSFGRNALSTGTVFYPRGEAPEGGWPVISWAHGTSGLGDQCAPSVAGPAESERDNAYLANWLSQGYAIVASDYAGLGTPGLQAYLDGRTTAHNVVDMVTAGRNHARTQAADRQLSRSWVVVGQSQGGGAAIYTARYATEFGGPDLDYRGAVGTGTPTYIEDLVSPSGPGFPPIALDPGTTSYISYIVSGLRYAHPELGIDSILTPVGQKYLLLGETNCVTDSDELFRDVVVGDFFTAPLTSLPGFTTTIDDYMAMPESGFDKPFFMGHGLIDTDVPIPPTAAYVARLFANGEPVTFKTYNTDHGGALTQSQADTVPFVAGLFDR